MASEQPPKNQSPDSIASRGDGNQPPASASAPAPKIFSKEAAEAALAELKAIFAAEEAAASAPPPVPPEPVEMSAEELAANPEEARRRFDAALAGLREASANWVAAKQEQFEQLLEFGWSGERDLSSFLKQMEQEGRRLLVETDEAEEDVFSTAGSMKSVEMDELLAGMKPEWDKLRAEGVPIEKRPLASGLPWSVQFQFQAENDPTGKDMEWWTAHGGRFAGL